MSVIIAVQYSLQEIVSCHPGFVMACPARRNRFSFHQCCPQAPGGVALMSNPAMHYHRRCQESGYQVANPDTLMNTCKEVSSNGLSKEIAAKT